MKINGHTQTDIERDGIGSTRKRVLRGSEIEGLI